jgi:putative Ig domain-containing protein
MIQLRKYFTPVLIIMLVLLVAGCSSSGGDADVPEEDLVSEEVASGIEDTLGGLFEKHDDADEEEEADPECEGDECEVVPPECEGDDCDEIGGIVETLRIYPNTSKDFEAIKLNEQVEVKTQLKATGGEDYIWSATGYPDGMKFDANTKNLTGTPTKLGIFNMEFTVAADVRIKTSKRKIAVQDYYTIELSYNGKGLDEALAELDNKTFPFYDRSLTANVLHGHASEYTWTVLIGGDVVDHTLSDEARTITFDLPDDFPKEVKEFDVKVSVVDESGREQIKTYKQLKRARDPCEDELEIEDIGYEGAIAGAALSAKGGMPPYTWSVEMERTAVLYDLDGEQVSNSTPVLTLDEDVLGQAALLPVNNLIREAFSLSKKLDAENGKYIVAVHNVAKVSGISKYELKGSATVTDSCETTIEKSFKIKKELSSVPTLDTLMMKCDFENINNAGSYNSYLEFRFHTGDGAVAKVHYGLAPCNHNEGSCEGEKDVVALEDGKDEDGEPKYFDLSEFDLNDIVNVKLIKHKSTYASGWSSGDVGKLDVDLQWCRFYTEDSGWFAIWDDQRNGDDLDEDEVSGPWCYNGTRSKREKYIIDKFDGWEENGSIWFMGDMLPGFSGMLNVIWLTNFDYITPRNNDGED